MNTANELLQGMLSAIAMRFIDQYFSVSNLIDHSGEERTGGSRGGALGARTTP